MFHKLFHDFVTLFVVINPVGTVPLFLAVAGLENEQQRRRIALQAVLIAAVILLVFIAIGQLVIEALDIDLASFQIAGGLVLLLIGLRMVLEEVRPPLQHTGSWGNVALFPLAMPFIAGPASLMAVMLLTDDNVYTVWEQVETAAIALSVLAITYGFLTSAESVQRYLGATGTSVVSRIMGLILSALAVQAMLGGLLATKLL